MRIIASVKVLPKLLRTVASPNARLDINPNAAVYAANAKLPEVLAAILSSSPGHAVNGNKSFKFIEW